MNYDAMNAGDSPGVFLSLAYWSWWYTSRWLRKSIRRKFFGIAPTAPESMPMCFRS